MSHEALYRKYRPGTFEEVLGQEQVVAALKGAIAQGKIGHAYLFAGGRGIGKTTLARIFAREVGTTDRDLYEIDAASNRGIDDVRALREEVHVLPFESPYKVYVIDEVHMLTKEAFNALLKTLEEPPKHVIFILATTEPEKLPDTIVSRCQAFTLKRPNAATLRDMITAVAKKEGYAIDPAGAELIALLADGAFRDAHGILQKVMGSHTGTTLTAEVVEEVTGAPKAGLIVALLDAIASGDLDSSLGMVRRLGEEGYGARMVMTLLLRLSRAVLLARSAPSMRDTLRAEFTEQEWAAIERHAKEGGARVNSRLLMGLLDAHMRAGTTHIPELPLELALIDHLGGSVEG